jgi:tripartite-type tricarboxylate transporter receptor subunit TctC
VTANGITRRAAIAALSGSTIALPGIVRAETGWPNRPITVVLPFAAGGAADAVLRIVADSVGNLLGQRLIVDNRAGAGGILGSRIVAAADPDGYTLVCATASTHAIAPLLSATRPYDPQQDFSPIGTMTSTPILAVVHPSVPAATFGELAAVARERGGQLNFGSPGVGTVGHLCGVMFNQISGGELTHVPYRGSGPAVQDLLSGTLQVIFENPPTVLPHIAAKTLRPIGLLAANRSVLLPDIASAAEQGLPNLVASSWTMLLGPRNLPLPIRDRISAALATALADPVVASRLEALAATPFSNTPDQTGAFLAQEIARWGETIRIANIRL